MNIDDSEKPKIIEQTLGYQDQCLKHNSSVINTNIFGNDKFNWVSAILFSRVEVCLLLEQAKNLPGINWGNKKNDFVIAHNPSALYPLSEDLFHSTTQLYAQSNQLLIRGENILPMMPHQID